MQKSSQFLPTLPFHESTRKSAETISSHVLSTVSFQESTRKSVQTNEQSYLEQLSTSDIDTDDNISTDFDQQHERPFVHKQLRNMSVTLESNGKSTIHDNLCVVIFLFLHCLI